MTALEPLARLAIALEVFLGVGALAGGAALMLGPRGEILPLPLSALSGSPFTDYLVPGAILLYPSDGPRGDRLSEAGWFFSA